jgi:hypothetical protein
MGILEVLGKSAVPRCWQLRARPVLVWSGPTAARLGSRAQPRLLSASLNLALCCEAREPYIKGSTEKQHNDKLPALHLPGLDDQYSSSRLFKV